MRSHIFIYSTEKFIFLNHLFLYYSFDSAMFKSEPYKHQLQFILKYPVELSTFNYV